MANLIFTVYSLGLSGLAMATFDDSKRHPFSREGKNLDNIQLTMLIKIEPNTAPQKPLTWNPLTRAETNQSISPLMTSKKSPRVTIVRGRVSKTRMGRSIVLTIPNRKADTRAAKKLSTQIILG